MSEKLEQQTNFQALQDSRSTALREIGLFILKSGFVLNSAAAVALIPLAGTVLSSDRREVFALAPILAYAGFCFVVGTLVALVLAGWGHYRLMLLWIRAEEGLPKSSTDPNGQTSDKSKARRASAFVWWSMVPAFPFLAGVLIIVCALSRLGPDNQGGRSGCAWRMQPFWCETELPSPEEPPSRPIMPSGPPPDFPF
jgi:hypothetical protein